MPTAFALSSSGVTGSGLSVPLMSVCCPVVPGPGLAWLSVSLLLSRWVSIASCTLSTIFSILKSHSLTDSISKQPSSSSLSILFFRSPMVAESLFEILSSALLLPFFFIRSSASSIRFCSLFDSICLFDSTFESVLRFEAWDISSSALSLSISGASTTKSCKYLGCLRILAGLDLSIKPRQEFKLQIQTSNFSVKLESKIQSII